jgi:hypothetical protein
MERQSRRRYTDFLTDSAGRESGWADLHQQPKYAQSGFLRKRRQCRKDLLSVHISILLEISKYIKQR